MNHSHLQWISDVIMNEIFAPSATKKHQLQEIEEHFKQYSHVAGDEVKMVLETLVASGMLQMLEGWYTGD